MKILAIKGGGVRGLLAARLGERLEKRAPGWSETAELLAGTSTGGILALGLAAGKTWKELRKLYQDHARDIFRPVAPDLLVRAAASVASRDLAKTGDLEDWVPGSMYSSEGLREVLEEAFGERRLGDLRRDVLVPTFCVTDDKWRAIWFNRQHDGNLRVVDVALATAAAPVYFPMHAGCLDGGMVANDPSLAALAHALGSERVSLFDVASNVFGSRTTGISVFTLGCGRGKRPKGFLDEIRAGGLLGPLAKGLDLLGDAHWELDPRLPEAIPLDGSALDGRLDEALEDLMAVGRETKLARTVEWLDAHGWA